LVATGLKPRDFHWIIQGKLAVSQRIGGCGEQHRRIRREEEITWVVEEGFTGILSLLEGNQNLSAYRVAGLEALHSASPTPLTPEYAERICSHLKKALEAKGSMILVHKDILDDGMTGLLGGYLVRSGLLVDPIRAMAVIQEIVARPLGPLGRSLIPAS
jgi:hypothetical protein